MADSSEEVSFNLSWGSSSKAPTYYAQQMYVTHVAGDFVVVFGELELPPPGVTLQEFGDKLRIEPVVKVAMTAELIVQMIAILQENLGKFLAQTEARKKKTEE